jgi:putative colanic acid biosysnthesis UDP-glucose lipid carrier transferase
VPLQSDQRSWDAALPDPRSLAALRATARMSLGRGKLLNAVEVVLEPLVLVASLWGVALWLEGRIAASHMILALVVFALTFPSKARLSQSRGRVTVSILASWAALGVLLALFGDFTGYLDYFHRESVLAWCWVAPWCQIGAHFALRAAVPALRAFEGRPKYAVLAGVNAPGLELARRLNRDIYSDTRVLGFVDDRNFSGIDAEYPVLGRIDALPELVKRHRIDIVYLALPMISGPRIRALLDALRDTTASVYFVPDLFITEPIQARIDLVSGMPLLGVFDSPFCGVNGLVKRGADVVLSALILALIAPLLLVLAACVKLTSPGPAIFRQRRYGLDGEEIVVYKLRTMTVTEDGDSIRQCGRADARVTPLGAFLRRTSLDELPQFINVLQGRMSIVGPRPHAVAHNELYRKVIKGYMQRHKVRPGLTGLAQVNGLRGETQSVEKMSARIEYDLDYLRHWSLGLDLYIIAKTVWIVLRDRNAY